MLYVDLNVQYQKSGTIQEVRKREFYENQALNVKRNQKLHVNVNSNN